jgi:hypothetical protein
MGTVQDHRKCAEQCVAMARAADDDDGKILWLTLALSWARLAEHAALAAPTEHPADRAEDVSESSSEGLQTPRRRDEPDQTP